jgi:c-di-GMP-binding flagellar brake protein YcgR
MAAMAKDKDTFIERRRFIRLAAPIDISYVGPEDGKIHNTATKNISANGLRLETHDKAFETDSVIELKLSIREAVNPVHAKGRVIWKRKMSLEDRAPFDVGIEIIQIEEDNKNTFLRFLCDLVYNLPEGAKDANEKI